jgi:prevent-host-death family protein
MKRASVTEAKNQLSALLYRVKRGQEVTMLERGRPIARLVPVRTREAADLEPWLSDLERRGLLDRGITSRGSTAEFPRLRLPPGSGLAEAVLAERAEDR